MWPIVRQPSWKEVQKIPTDAQQTKRSNDWKMESQPYTYFARRKAGHLEKSLRVK
jgi:hypothetical protein